MKLATTVGGLLVMFAVAGCGGQSQQAGTSTDTKAASTVEQAVQKTEAGMAEVGEKIQGSAETAGEAMGKKVDEARELISDKAGEAKTMAAEKVEDAKTMMAEKVEDAKAMVTEKSEEAMAAMKEASASVAQKVSQVKAETEKAVTSVVSGAAAAMSTQAPVGGKEFFVYTDKNARTNHFAPSGWMGDYGDIKLDEQYSANAHSGTTALQFVYSAKKSQNAGWAGVFWQNPPNNWGTKKGGFNLSGMTKLSFWARGEKGGELIQKFMVGGIKGQYPDTAVVEMGPVELSKDWKEYSIVLAGKDLSFISGGFGWATTEELNPQGATFYLDDIKFIADPSVKPEGKKQQVMPFAVYTDRGAVGNHFIPSGWMGDYGDMKIDQAFADKPHGGKSSIKITYTNSATQGARWAGMFWQQPANNWGTIADAGYDLSKAKKLIFWARGEKGGEQIAEFKVGGIMGEYPDSDSAVIGPVVLNKDWTEYTIDLAGKDMSFIIGGFCWASNIDLNPEGMVFYLDDIRFE